MKLAADETTMIDVVCDDTDVFVLLLHFFRQENITTNIRMVGTSSNRKVVDIKATSEKNADIVKHILPASHVISGCDTVSQFFGIGKGTVKTLKAKYTLENLGNVEADFDQVVEEATGFVGACYGVKDAADMSVLRYSVWASKMANLKLTSAPKLKTIPPTTAAFREHVRRAHFQTAIWRHALEPDAPPIRPQEYGWSLDHRTRSLVPTTVPQDTPSAPANVLQLIKCGCSSEMPCSTTRCGCRLAQLSCSVFCKCIQHYTCYNDKTAIEQNDSSDDDADDVDNVDNLEI